MISLAVLTEFRRATNRRTDGQIHEYSLYGASTASCGKNYRMFVEVAKLVDDVDCSTLSEDGASCVNPSHDVVQRVNVRLDDTYLPPRLRLFDAVHGQRVPAEVAQHVLVKPGCNDPLTNLVTVVTKRPYQLQPTQACAATNA